MTLTSKTRRASRPPSLFPFLSVLFCLIGAMMFIGVGVAFTGYETAETQVSIRLAAETEEGFSSVDRAPIVLECAGDSAVSLDGRFVFVLSTEQEVRRGGGPATPFGVFLDSLAAEGGQHVLFAVRPSGIEVYKYLRESIRDGNDERTTGVVSISERPWWERAELPTEILDRTRYDNGRLHFTGLMSEPERDLLKTLFDLPASLREVDRLLDETRLAASRNVGYGTELVPADWSIRVTR